MTDHGAAADSEARLRRLIDAAPFGAHVYELHPDGRLVFVSANESANRILGVDCSQFVGMTIEDAFPPLSDTPIPGAYRAVASTGEPYHEEQVTYDEGRISGVFDVHALQIAPNMMATFFQDITERRRAEEHRARLELRLRQAQKMVAIGELAGGIAHDFNNLLTGIAGYAELLRETFPPGDPRIDDVEQIRKASDSGAALIRQLLAFSRQDVLNPTLVDVGERVRGAERMLRRILGEDVTLVTTVEPDLDRVMADETHVVQVVLNLAVNARDAMPNGGTLTIDVSNVLADEAFAQAHPPLEPGRHVALSVSDTGFGMDEATLERAFEPFFTTKEPGKGTGLGLATVYGIVQRWGGAVSVESEVGAGSRFTVFLPSQAHADADVGERTVSPPREHRSGTILVVEDAPDVRTYVTRVLRGNGHRVLVADDGASGLALAAKHLATVDVLLTDVVMPGMSGRELAQRMQATVPGIRVVYMSGYAATVISDEVAAAPGFTLLMKPFAADELESVIQDALAPR